VKKKVSRVQGFKGLRGRGKREDGFKGPRGREKREEVRGRSRGRLLTQRTQRAQRRTRETREKTILFGTGRVGGEPLGVSVRGKAERYDE